jgi:hypothetical protein
VILTYWSMRKHARTSSYAVPVMMGRLAAASWETIWRRTLMMAEGTCSLAEYQRMTAEKIAAVQTSMGALMTGRGHAAALAPFVNRTRANARRLRRKS